MPDTTTPAPPKHGPLRNVEGLELSELARRTSQAVTVLTDRAAVEVLRDTGSSARVDALQKPALTIVLNDGSPLHLSIQDLAVLAELANATAAAEVDARATGSRGASACHVVPDTLTPMKSGEYSGGLSVTGAWIRPGSDVNPASGFRRMRVVLTESRNTFLTYPVVGELHVSEMSTDGFVTHAQFRVEKPDGTLGAAVDVPAPRFVYEPRPRRDG